MKIKLPTVLIIFVLLVYPPNIHAQIITTVAGTYGKPGFGGDGGPATSAFLHEVWGVAVDSNGDYVYIADGYNIRMVNSLGIISTVAGNGTSGYSGDGGPATDAELDAGAVAVDGNGNIYIVDDVNSVIRKVNSSGIISTLAGTALNHPSGVAVDNRGNLYISDKDNFRIRKIDTAGLVSTFAGNGTYGFSLDGGAATASQLSSPFGVAVDRFGNVYIADGGMVHTVDTFGIIRSVAGNGTPGLFGDGGPATAASTQPYGAAIDSLGNIYIADFQNNRIRLVTTNGIISTYAGNGLYGSGGDGGPAIAARLNYPIGVAVDRMGNLYIADWQNYLVRKVSSRILTVNNVATTNTPFEIYPNPTTGSFTLQLPQTNSPTTITITNLLGTTIETKTTENTQHQNLSFDLHTPPGTYIIKVSSGDNTWREKVQVW